MVFYLGLVLPPRRQLAPSEDDYGCYGLRQGVCCWHLVGRDQGHCGSTSYSAQGSPTAKNYLAQNVNNAEAEKPALAWWESCRVKLIAGVPRLHCIRVISAWNKSGIKDLLLYRVTSQSISGGERTAKSQVPELHPPGAQNRKEYTSLTFRNCPSSFPSAMCSYLKKEDSGWKISQEISCWSFWSLFSFSSFQCVEIIICQSSDLLRMLSVNRGWSLLCAASGSATDTQRSISRREHSGTHFRRALGLSADAVGSTWIPSGSQKALRERGFSFKASKCF